MSHDYSDMEGTTYECVKCQARFDGKEISLRGRISCPACGYRVIRKVRPPIVKRVKAK